MQNSRSLKEAFDYKKITNQEKEKLISDPLVAGPEHVACGIKSSHLHLPLLN